MNISNKKQFIIFLLISILIISTILIYFFKIYKPDYEILESENILENIVDTSLNTLSTNDTTNNLYSNSNEEDFIIIHITGAIHNPGIVKLNVGSRIADAINSAGGFTDDSDISSVNLAFKLTDGEKLYIPFISDEYTFNNNSEHELISSEAGENIILESSDTNSINSTKSNIDLININSATQTELETIPGIGPSTALKIIEYRNQNGQFNDINDIKNISGIGNAKYNSIKNYITIK